MTQEELKQIIKKLIREELKNELLIKSIITEMILEGTLVQHLVEQIVKGSTSIVEERIVERETRENKIDNSERMRAHLANMNKRIKVPPNHGADEMELLNERFKDKNSSVSPAPAPISDDLATRDPARAQMLENEGVSLDTIQALMGKRG